jgi:hypothetical protein
MPEVLVAVPRALAEHREVVPFRMTDLESRPLAQPVDEGSF